MKTNLRNFILVSFIGINSCAVLVKDSDIKDEQSTIKTAENIVNINKIKNVKVKNIAIIGFSSNLFSGDNSSSSIGGINTGLVSTIADASSKRGCIALAETHKIALKTFKDYGFNILPEAKLLKSQTYMNMGSKDFPGLCTTGNTRINLFPPEKEMNKLFNELKVDALMSVNMNAKNDESSSANIYVWTKGTEKAEYAWVGYLGKSIKIESDTQMFFRDFQDLSRTDEKKIAITTKVYLTSFKLLAAKMAEDLK